MARILALDYGTRRIGAALGESGGSISSPLEAYERRDAEHEARHYRSLVAAHGVEKVVVGLPVHGDGSESAMSRAARTWGAWLEKAIERPVVFFDERYSSIEAEELLIAGGVKRSKRVGRRDMIAAGLLLSAYLEAGCPDNPAPTKPLDDRHG